MKRDRDLLPKSEYRRQYMESMINEGMLLFGMSRQEAKVWASQTVLYMRAKFDHEDAICFGTGKIFPKRQKPRDFKLYSGANKVRQTVSMGERLVWAVKFFSSRKGIN